MNGAWIWAPSPEQWDGYWLANQADRAVGRREEILTRVMEETIRKRASSAKGEISEDGVNLKF